MKRMLAMLICAAALAAGQTPPADATPQPAETARPRYLQKVIDVKYADPRSLADLIKNLERWPDDRVNPQVDLHAIAIGTHDPEFLRLAEEIVKRFDVPRLAGQHEIELTAYILVASPKGTAGDALPADLDGVAKQLQSVFGYHDLKLLDTALIRAHEGGRGGDLSGNLAALSDSSKQPPIYNLRFQNATVRQLEGRKLIDLSQFRFDVRIGYPDSEGKINWNSLGFNTDLSIGESQKVVVGKSKIGSGDQALILVLTARVVD